MHTNLVDICHHLCAAASQKVKISKLSFCKWMVNYGCDINLTIEVIQEIVLDSTSGIALETTAESTSETVWEPFLEFTLGKLPGLASEVSWETFPEVALEVILARRLRVESGRYCSSVFESTLNGGSRHGSWAESRNEPAVGCGIYSGIGSIGALLEPVPELFLVTSAEKLFTVHRYKWFVCVTEHW